MSNFKILHKDGKARVGVLKTAHGEVMTPTFMPVGTQASVKSLDPRDLKNAGAQIILGNTYHLYLRPGSKLIKKMGGLHKFMNWDGPILTDSGGFQAFSLGAMIEHGVRKVPAQSKTSRHPEERDSDEGSIQKIPKQVRLPQRGNADDNKNVSHKVYKSRRIYREKPKDVVRQVTVVMDSKNQTLSKITDEGVKFISHLDGSKHLLTPEKSIEVQLDLGSDIVLVLDELLSPLHNKTYVRKSLERTHNWGLRSKKYFEKNLSKSTNPGAMLFGILQGVYDQKIREGEAKWVAEQGFDGVSIGGSFGTSKYWPGNESGFWEGVGPEERTNWAASTAIYKTMEWVVPILPEEMPKHALGIGEVQDFFECVERGIDMFDCVAPTRRARNGSLYIQPKNGGTKANESRKLASSSGPFGTSKNKFVLSIQRVEFSDDPRPIDPGCLCFSCQNFSRSYLRHLFVSGEILYHRLATIHNVYFINHLVEQIREAIIGKRLNKLKTKWLG